MTCEDHVTRRQCTTGTQYARHPVPIADTEQTIPQIHITARLQPPLPSTGASRAGGGGHSPAGFCRCAASAAPCPDLPAAAAWPCGRAPWSRSCSPNARHPRCSAGGRRRQGRAGRSARVQGAQAEAATDRGARRRVTSTIEHRADTDCNICSCVWIIGQRSRKMYVTKQQS